MREMIMYKSKMMIVMRRDLKMRKGKIAAQAGHACIEAILTALQKEGRMNDFELSENGMVLKNSEKSETPLSEWFGYGCAKICVYVDSEEELLQIADKATERGIIASVITDAGMTGPAFSVFGVEPSRAIDRMKNSTPVRFETASGESKMDCVFLKIDENSGKTLGIRSFEIRDVAKTR